ncbi:MAG TPA: FHA domain-containing protein [Streptosporangiaceae bacterium]|nr:FHA domain-containing protein [Streptosporangiaceae bacterium]
MTDRRVAEWPLARAHLVQRRRRRAVAAGIVAGWILLLIVTRSLLAGTALLLLLAALGAGCVAGIRVLGAGARRPRTGVRDRGEQEAVWEAGSGGSGAAWSEPGAAWREPGASGARSEPEAAWREPGAAWAERVGDSGHGRDDLRYGDDGYLSGHDQYAGGHRGYAAGHDGHTLGGAAAVAAQVAAAATVATGAPTVAAPGRPQVPLLKLVTGDSMTQTRTSGARAGRGPVDLVLPEVPTVSREHARFTFADGQWWVVNLGRNGLMLNGVPLTGAHPLRDGDSVHWGQTPDALLSRIEIG